MNEIRTLMRANYPLIAVQTTEETRAIRSIENDGREIVKWTITRGWETSAKLTLAKTGKPAEALAVAAGLTIPVALILPDFGRYMEDAPTLRALRDTIESYRESDVPQCVVLIAPSIKLPAEIEKYGAIVDLPLPDRSEIAEIIVRAGAEPSEAAIVALIGLTETEIENAISKSLEVTGKLDPRVMHTEKKEIVRKSGILDFIDTSTTPDAIGGLAGMKGWLEARKDASSERARAFGLPTPKGVVILGPPGTGKSLTATMVGSLRQIPTVRMDMGRIYGGIVGSSEENMRRAIKTVEAIAPCVLWIDEIEKGIAGGGGDSGTSSRVLGTLLTWFQEKTADVFVVATANDVSKLPPELLRKGRFDEIFFVDLPNASEREDIFRVCLRRVRPNIETFDFAMMAERTDTYTGAEIRAIVEEAMFNAFAEGGDIETRHCLDAVPTVVPLARSMARQIDDLREWAKGRTRPANGVAVRSPTTTNGKKGRFAKGN